MSDQRNDPIQKAITHTHTYIDDNYIDIDLQSNWQ